MEAANYTQNQVLGGIGVDAGGIGVNTAGIPEETLQLILQLGAMSEF